MSAYTHNAHIIVQLFDFLFVFTSRRCASEPAILRVPERPRLHDTTGCQSGLTTGCIVYTNIQPVVKPV